MDRRNVLRSIGAGALGAAGAAATSGSAAADESDDHYHNPVGPIGFGDVTVIQAQEEDNDNYYAYGTETPLDIVPIAESEDMYSWEYIAPALEEYPDWRDDEDAGVWAPDINYYDGQYHLYYSYSTWGSQNNPGIGLATSDTPDGPFEDQGPVFRAEDLGMTNAIDGELRVVDSTPYMIWGSWYGIHGVELTEDGADYVEDTDFHLAGDMREGAMMIEENGYYYLFYSTGNCCDGYQSTYEVEVGRSENFEGPYVNQNGTDLRDLTEHRDGVAILSATDRFTGPGHNTAYQDENGDWWMFYHVEGTEDQDEATRIMMMDRIRFDEDDWPVVACNGYPSATSPVPNSGEYDCEGENFETSYTPPTDTSTATATPTATPTPTATDTSTRAPESSPTATRTAVLTSAETGTPAETSGTVSDTGDGMSVLAGVAALGTAAAGALGYRRTRDDDAE